MTAKARIRGLGRHVPSQTLTNAQLEALVDTTDEWIVTRTGITERRIAGPGETCSELSFHAAEAAIADAKIAHEDITHILLATITADHLCPNGAVMLAERLGLKNRLVIDCNAACSGFLYTLELARGLIAADPGAKVLVGACEILTSRTNWEDRATCVLFGDGAAVAVVDRAEETSGGEIIDILWGSDGSLADVLLISGGGSAHPYKLGEEIGPEFFVRMQGREVFKNAVRHMADVCTRVLERNGYTSDDVNLFVPHQANLRIIEALAKRMNFDANKIFTNVQRYGNTSAASVPIALAEARMEGRLKTGDLVLTAAFGAGLTWAAGLFRF